MPFLAADRFNGATAFRRWKFLTPPPPPHPEASFNGATAFRRWKSINRLLQDGELISSFNGATAFRRWKSDTVQWNPPNVQLLQWGHRLSAMEIRPSRSAWASPGCSFNGATAFRRWKSRMGMDAMASLRKLQWGHRLSAMEIELQDVDYSTPFWLQWGHRLSAMEIAICSYIRLTLSVTV